MATRHSRFKIVVQTGFSVDFDDGNTEIGRVGQGTAARGTLTVHAVAQQTFLQPTNQPTNAARP